MDLIKAFSWLSLTAELGSMIVAFSIWLKIQSNSLLWLTLYITIDFTRGNIGTRMSEFRIHNHSFFYYSSLISLAILFPFVMSILKEKKHRVRTIWAFAIVSIASIAPEFTISGEQFRPHSYYPILFSVFAGVMILNDRVHHHEGKRFNNDPWSVIALVFVITESFCLISLFVGYSTLFLDLPTIFTIAYSFVGTSVTVKYLLFSWQLWKLKKYTWFVFCRCSLGLV